ncbi:MAG: recombinase family protein [Candidatus Sericytochromatia bacterium]|nr:recombinase family protein [Candidatus Sericytochromatia bacterium]
MATIAAVYTRVLGDMSGNEDNRSSIQVMKCREFCRQNAYSIKDEFIFIETIPSVGSDGNRPVYDAMMKLAYSDPSPFKAIIVLELIRFMRDRDIRDQTKERLLVHGVKLVSIKDGARIF